ncbi:MAG: TRAP transporter permease DctQ [Hyphomicrobiales bacterium]|nr:TRAP transporter small permease [Hyphomicrobiales bacterium]PCJ88761.1 MAG: TRAP transporter permease DctQ [Hyphomicrobiales bacterium]
MGQFISTIERLSRFATGIAFGVLIMAVTIQVLGRTFFSSPVWTEELTRYALLFLAAFGVGLSYRSGDLVNVDMLCESLPGNWPRRMRIISAFATALLCFMLLIPAWKYTAIGVMQTSPAIGLRMDFIHVSVLILLASLFLFSVARVLSMVLGQSEGRPDPMSGEGA